MPAEKRATRRPRLLLVLILVSVAGAAAVPFVIQRQLDRTRNEIIEVAAPAQLLVAEIQAALALESAGMRGYLLTGEEPYREAYARAHARRDRALRRLLPVANRLSPEIHDTALAILSELREADARLDAVVTGVSGPAEYVAELSAQQASLELVTERTSWIIREIERERAALRARIQSAERVGTALVIGFNMLAVLAIALVMRLARERERLAQRLDARARQQEALRHAASELGEMLSVGETVEAIARHAVETTNAFGAYVERALDPAPGSEEQVEVVAVAGNGAPPVGTRAPYPGSLSEEVITTGIDAIGASMEPYLRETCHGCHGFVVPLMSEGQVLGALVLLRSPEQRPFTWEEANHVRALAVLASTALRRVLLLEALGLSESRFRQLADHLDEVIWLGAPNLSELYYVNPAYERVWGRSVGSFLQAPRTLVETAHPEDRGRIESALANLPMGATYDEEYRIVRPDGAVRWVWSRIYPIYDDSGKVYRVAGIAKDVTDQKAAEQEREELLRREREARAQVTTILESITEAFFAVDREWRFTYVNHEAERMMRQEREDLLGKVVWDVYQPIRGTRFEAAFREAMAENRTIELEDYYEPLGMWLNVRAYPSATGLSVAFRDVTERKRAEEELRVRVQQLGALSSLGQEALTETDLDALFDRVVRIVAEHLDVEYVELLHLRPGGSTMRLEAGMGWKEGLVGTAEVSAGRTSMAGYAMLSSEPVVVRALERETRFRPSWLLREHGIRSGISVVVEGRQQPWGALGGYSQRERRFSNDDIFFLQSVSNVLAQAIELRRTEAEREDLLSRERKAREETEQRQAELERVTESRNRLMRGFGHDLKNPLGAANGQLHLLEDGIFGPLEPKQAESVERARRSIGAALNLITDLLALARAETGELEVERAPLDLREVARELAEEYRAQAESEGLSLHFDIPPELPAIRSDAMRIRQVVGNLLSNAVKYTDEGGVTVRASMREGGDAPGPGRWIAVDVADTGPGLSPEQQAQLFQEFHRLEVGDQTAGAGIGLAISRHIARALGGEITVSSEVGEGSTFTLWLPAEEGAAEERSLAAD